MKECKNCEYCDGFDYSDGTPECSYEGGHMNCPFNDHEQVHRNRNSDNAFQIIIDGKAMEEYIKNTVSNTVENEAVGMAKSCIEKMISDKFEEIIESFTEAEVKLQVEKQVAAFMAGDITAGGGWGEPARTLTREAYLNEMVLERLDKAFERIELDREITSIVKNEISKFSRTMRDTVNANVKNCFDEITRKTLTDNVVNMLMSSDTYKTLAENMSNLLPEK